MRRASMYYRAQIDAEIMAFEDKYCISYLEIWNIKGTIQPSYQLILHKIAVR